MFQKLPENLLTLNVFRVIGYQTWSASFTLRQVYMALDIFMLFCSRKIVRSNPNFFASKTCVFIFCSSESQKVGLNQQNKTPNSFSFLECFALHPR